MSFFIRRILCIQFRNCKEAHCCQYIYVFAHRGKISDKKVISQDCHTPILRTLRELGASRRIGFHFQISYFQTTGPRCTHRSDYRCSSMASSQPSCGWEHSDERSSARSTPRSQDSTVAQPACLNRRTGSCFKSMKLSNATSKMDS